jgi:hypothetical protein
MDEDTIGSQRPQRTAALEEEEEEEEEEEKEEAEDEGGEDMFLAKIRPKFEALV